MKIYFTYHNYQDMSRFNCSHCSYETETTSSWNKHILTKKHLKNVCDTNGETPSITKDELVRQCKVYGFKNISKKTKEELSKILENPSLYRFSNEVLSELVKTYDKNILVKKCKKLGFLSVEKKSKTVLSYIVENPEKYRFSYIVLNELKSTVRANKNYCIYCSEMGHTLNKCNNLCHIKKVMVDYFLDTNVNETDDMNTHFEIISKETDVPVNVIEELYALLRCIKHSQNCFDVDKYFENIYQHIQECYECKEQIYDICKTTTYTWKGHVTCDRCWSKYKDEIQETWLKVKEYSPQCCFICLKDNIMDHNRYHYDHKNMFEKSSNIFTMVNEGRNINEIYEELDKCQSMCLQCHHIVTDIENKLGFTLVKINLSRKLTAETITIEDYNAEVELYKKIYSKKMNPIYSQLQKKLSCV